MINEPVGLATTATTWYWLAGVLVLWLLTFPLLVRSWRPAANIVVSLLGLSWLSYGLGILIRFALLSYDAEEFASPSLRLSELSPESVDYALMTAGLFWLMFAIGAVIVQALPPPRALTLLLRQTERLSPESALPVIALCSGCVLAVLVLPLPAALVTPVSLLGSMWVVPAAVVWVGHFSGARRPGWVLAATLMPGVIRLVLSPYREQILVMVLVVIGSAIYARRRLNLLVLAPLGVVAVIVSTVAVSSYRQILWSGVTTAEVMADSSFTEVERWSTRPMMENLRRFHVFDSLLLTVDLVPGVFPFADRQPLLEAVTRGLLPRAVNPDKEQSDQGLRFQTRFWAYYNDPTLEEEDATAAIAPSMPGSLYEAGGLREVAAGGFLWAALLAVLTRTIGQRRTPGAVGLYVLCAVQAMAGVERDYVMAMSTLLQTLIVFFGLCALSLLHERRGELALGPRQASTAP